MPRVHSLRLSCALFILWVAASIVASSAHAQFFQRQAVGGVSINPEGVLTPPTAAEIQELRENNAKLLKKPPRELAERNELRMVSLRAIRPWISAP